MRCQRAESGCVASARGHGPDCKCWLTLAGLDLVRTNNQDSGKIDGCRRSTIDNATHAVVHVIIIFFFGPLSFPFSALFSLGLLDLYVHEHTRTCTFKSVTSQCLTHSAGLAGNSSNGTVTS